MTGRKKYEKNLFFIGAIWNWTFTVLFIGVTIFDRDSLTLFMTKIPENLLWFMITVACIGLFGFAYYYISKDVVRNRDIIKIATVGKMIFFVLFLINYSNGFLTLLTFLGGCGDLIFSFLFIDVLVKLKKTYN